MDDFTAVGAGCAGCLLALVAGLVFIGLMVLLAIYTTTGITPERLFQ